MKCIFGWFRNDDKRDYSIVVATTAAATTVNKWLATTAIRSCIAFQYTMMNTVIFYTNPPTATTATAWCWIVGARQLSS